jgi:outer membrane protein assembly factor BamB
MSSLADTLAILTPTPPPSSVEQEVRTSFARRGGLQVVLLGVLLGAWFAVVISGARAAEVASPQATAETPDIGKRRGEDWGAFLGPTGNGRSGLQNLRTPWAEGGPPVVWHCAVGEGYCAPAVALGRAVIFDRIGQDMRLRCLEAETGRKLWEERYPADYADMFGYDGGPRAAPVIARDRVVTFGPEGRLECRCLADGALVWKIDTGRAYHVVQNFFGVGAAPLVVDAGAGPLVVVQVGGSRPGSAPPAPERLDLVKGLDSGLVAFDLATGRERWRASSQLASYSAPVLARIGDRTRILAWMRDELIVVDPATGTAEGSFRWRADEVFSAVCASPVADGGCVLLSECYEPGSVLLDLATGADPRPLRQDRRRARPDAALKAHWATPVLHDGHLFGSSGRHAGDAVLACVDWKTGTVRWTEGGCGRASTALVDGHLLVLAEQGDLTLVRAAADRYVEVSRTRLLDPADRRTPLLAPPCWAAPVIARGLGYVRGQGRLVCVALAVQ